MNQLNEEYFKISKLKSNIQIDVDKYSADNSYLLPDDCKNVLQAYMEKQNGLEDTWKALLLSNQGLKNQIEFINREYQSHLLQQSNIIQKKKFENLLQSSKEIEMSINKIYKTKLDKLKQQKDRMHLFSGMSQQNQSDDKIGLLIDQSNSLNNSHKMVEESLQIGNEVLLSFGRQQSNLKNIQNKVNNLMGDMGLSQGIIKLIGSRDGQDKRIIAFLSTILLLFIIALYYNFR